jgi:Protein of unknown function (DUF3147)
MIPTVDPSSIKNVHWRQFLVRFVLGGTVTLCTGLIAQHWGPVIGGLFLSFPAIFPASATLIEAHESEKKRQAGIISPRRGRKAAALDAAGAVLGAWGMTCFACVAWLALPRYPAVLALSLAGVLWLAASISLWWVRRRARSALRVRHGHGGCRRH